jgi:hypothetical protein
MPLQYFESVWLRCVPFVRGRNKWLLGNFHSGRPGASAEDHTMCADLHAVANASRHKYTILSHPLDRLALTYDIWK